MGTQLSPRKGAQQAPSFGPLCTVAHLSNCWPLVCHYKSVRTFTIHMENGHHQYRRNFRVLCYAEIYDVELFNCMHIFSVCPSMYLQYRSVTALLTSSCDTWRTKNCCIYPKKTDSVWIATFSFAISLLLCPRERLRSIVMSRSMSVCVSVCPLGYLRNHTRDLYQFFAHVAYIRGSVFFRHVYNRLHRLTAGRGDGVHSAGEV